MGWNKLSDETKEQMREQVARFGEKHVGFAPSDDFVMGTITIALDKAELVLNAPPLKPVSFAFPSELTPFGRLVYEEHLKRAVANLAEQCRAAQLQVAREVLCAFGASKELAEKVVQELTARG